MNEVLVERRGDVVWLTFNRPDARNAMTFAMYERMAEVAGEVDADRGVRALVLTGAGGAFVAGTDISQFSGFTRNEDALEYEARMDAWMSALERVRVPTIAALRGRSSAVAPPSPRPAICASPRRRRASAYPSRARWGTASQWPISCACRRSSGSRE